MTITVDFNLHPPATHPIESKSFMDFITGTPYESAKIVQKLVKIGENV